jgi:hypothetical protein
MTGTEARWAGVEVAVSQEPGDLDRLRVVFERAGATGPGEAGRRVPGGGRGAPGVRFVRPAGAAAAGPHRAECERQAVAVIRNLAEALARD